MMQQSLISEVVWSFDSIGIVNSRRHPLQDIPRTTFKDQQYSNNMHCIIGIALLASVALCGADVSHLSRSYLPPASGGVSSYASYPSYSSGLASNGAYAGGYSSGATPLLTSSYRSYAAPQYNNYATPSRAYLAPVQNYVSAPAVSYSSGLDTKYADNGGYVY
ncbi:uncharacterized protein LOC115627366 [Scaptodrosophila lebanonensis]|uniref:Uncharacterized protein LOC115627366 n=1 Tax=Drosophila lebanonensis TaxID=7225 RepID=A0A6J2TQC8_DROLE|nr:uncharacterized protein LOC115627366 [Scaptodrosophila lebanonensis]